MSRLELLPFADDHIEAAGRLLAARHARHLEREPLLDPRFADPTAAAQEVAARWAVPDASGAVAVTGGEVVGYLVGAPSPSPTWGPNTWVESAGFAVVEPETTRDLYAAAAGPWVDAGRTAHYVVVPSHDTEVLDAWCRLAFGQQHAHAVRGPAEAPHPLPAGVQVRRAERADIPVLARLELALPEHHGRSPVFASGGIPTLEEATADWEESFDDERFATFVAEHGGRVVGSAVGCSIELSSGNTSLMRPAHAGFLGFAAVLPEARGVGAGRALGEAVIDWSAAAGFTSVTTDWRVTNLLSSRAWPRLGFRPAFLRMHRIVGH